MALNVSLIVQSGMLILGLYWLWISIKMVVFPHAVGILLEDPSTGCSCDHGGTIRGSVRIRVGLKDGTVIEAMASPCLFCLETIRKGDRLGITRFGDQWVAQRSPGWGRWNR